MHRLLPLLLSFWACPLLAAPLADGPLWMRYPALSPDGQTIVFSYQGDLYRVPAAGGTAVPITLHEAHEFRPVWSPDGKQLAFASDRYGNYDVFVMPATGGAATRLTYHSADDLPTDFSTDGERVIFSSARTDDARNAQFPTRLYSELYEVAATGGRTNMVLTTPALEARYAADGKQMVYEDVKGYEDPWRKHHTSSVTRDVWLWNPAAGTHTQLTTFEGENRDPAFGPGGAVYYLSEESGTFNVRRMDPNTPGQSTAVTHFDTHPVRFLSVADDGTLAFGYHGALYTQRPGGEPRKVDVRILTDGRTNEEIVSVSGGATEMALSPDGKEIAFVNRGEVFVTSVDGKLTKRVTNTPTQERSVSFSPDGRSLLYAGERDGSWNVYRAKIRRDEESFFHAATVLDEEAVVATDADEFQPHFSPDGKEVAYLEKRVILRVKNLASGAVRTVLPEKHNNSYSDGDQHYDWSPDGRWFLGSFTPDGQYFNEEVGLVPVDGSTPPRNLTMSGYGDYQPRWAMGGKAVLWYSDRDGMKDHGSWGAQGDAYAMFFTQKAYDRFQLDEEAFNLLKEREKADTTNAEPEQKKRKKKDEAKEEEVLTLELDNLDDRKARLTLHSSDLADAVLSDDGETLYYLAKFEKGYDLWQTKLRTRETKLLKKLEARNGELALSKDGKALFLLADGNFQKIDPDKGSGEGVTVQGEMTLDRAAEREYIFHHAWRQVREKFYLEDLHGVDWVGLRDAYAPFLTHINNNWDFAEMLSELLGELNASHTGARYRPQGKTNDATASLGLFYDPAHTGAGLRVAEVMAGGPLDRADSDVRPGVIIERIDGEAVTPDADFYRLLNRKSARPTLLSLRAPGGKTWEEQVRPITLGEESELRYRRWVEQRRQATDSLSDGTVGYVHVRGMNDQSYRTVVEEVLGRHADKASLIVDTRFNGGGWLHDDLVTFLSGEKYIDIQPRGVHRGHEPFKKWIKPSVVLMSESNYSDAHMFPYAYKTLNVGKLIGMPVPGTGTAVWWEQQIDPTLVFGIPQIGMLDTEGRYLENQQLEPDVRVDNPPAELAEGKDPQLERAVIELLKEQDGDPVGRKE
ncbi:MAG: S41 family peptidase [Catalinimonas sp.]